MFRFPLHSIPLNIKYIVSIFLHIFSVAVLIFNTTRQAFVMVKQFRPGELCCSVVDNLVPEKYMFGPFRNPVQKN